MPRIVAIALLAFIASGAGAQNPKPAEVRFSAGHIDLAVTEAGTAAGGLTAEWQFDRADNGDVRIIKNERRGTAKVSGTVLSVYDDQALLFKDIIPGQQRELQELNDPVLHLQLVLRLLARAMPQGLPAPGSQIGIDISEDKNTLRVRKGYSARKDFGAPWRVRGNASRGTGEEVRFDLVMTFAADSAKGKPAELKLAGVWAQQSRMPALDSGFSLAGWRVHRIDTVPEMVGGNAMLDSVSVATPMQFATLGDVRARIGRWWDPDVKAPQRAECIQ